MRYVIWLFVILIFKCQYYLTRNCREERIVNMRKVVPIWEKSTLTLEEAAAYSGIGICKLKELTNSEKCKFVLWNGSKRLIKRKQLDEYIDRAYSI